MSSSSKKIIRSGLGVTVAVDAGLAALYGQDSLFIIRNVGRERNAVGIGVPPWVCFICGHEEYK